MGLLDIWKRSEKIAEAAEKKPDTLSLKDLLEKNDQNSRIFADLLRKGAEGGDTAAETALKNLLDKKQPDPANAVKLIEYHQQFIGHVEKVARVRHFLTDEMITALGEHSDTFSALSSLFGTAAGVRPEWDKAFLHLAVNEPSTFASIERSSARFIEARKLSKAAAARVVAKEKLPGVDLAAIADITDRKDRLKLLREKISKHRFWEWQKTIDKYTFGFFSRMSARSADRRIAPVLDAERAEVVRDMEKIGNDLNASVQAHPQIQLAFIRAAVNNPVPEAESFPKLYEAINFQARMRDAWQTKKPAGFNSRNPNANTQRQTFFAQWKIDYASEINSRPLNVFWKPTVISFLNSFNNPNLSALN